MKIKELKYILLLFVGSVLFYSGITVGGCIQFDGSPHGAGSDSSNPPHSCISNASPGTNERYNNNRPNNNETIDRFLLIIDKPRSYDCGESNNYNVSDMQAIQTKLQEIGTAIGEDHCSTCIDGKYGVRTQQAISQCLNSSNLCLDPNETPNLSNGELSCRPGYTVRDSEGRGYLCCEQDVITISGPDFTDGEWNQDTMEGVSITFHIEGYDESMDVAIDDSKISVDGGTIIPDPAGQVDDNGYVDYFVNILVQGDSATINVLEGVVNVGNNNSESATHEITKPENEPESEASECDHPIEEGGDCQDVYGGYFSFDSETNCCVQGGCNRPVNDAGECDDEGYANDGNGCCSLSSLVCTETQYSQGGNCIDCTGDTIANPSHTKCICDSSKKCCGIQLNMSIPFIGDCIENESDGAGGTGTTVVNSVTAFPILMQGMMKIVMSAILVVSFLLVIVSGFMMTAGAFKSTNFDKGKTMIKNVIISLILLGLSGLILKLINPSFFGG